MSNTKESSKTGSYWLPEDYVLKLTALEAGALLAIVHSTSLGGFVINKPDPKGNPVETNMRDRLLEKLYAVYDAKGQPCQP